MVVNRFTDEQLAALRNLQERQAEWIKKQPFRNGPVDHPCLGMIEETGELAHAVLKLEQGIRGTREELIDKAQDAIGDVATYLADYCTRTGIDLAQTAADLGYTLADSARFPTTPTRLEPATMLGSIARVGYQAFMIAEYQDDPNTTGGHQLRVGWLTVNLLNLCKVAGWDLTACIERAISEVERRTWSENSETGVAS